MKSILTLMAPLGLAAALSACAPVATQTVPAPTPAPAPAPTPAPAPVDQWVPMAPLSSAPVREFAAPQQVTDPTKLYRAVLKTSRGPITLELYPAEAPQAVNNFVFLALNHFYDGTRFHRVIDGFMAQGGDPLSADLARRSEWGTGGPGYSFSAELGGKLRFDQPGILGMARSASLSSQGSQFYITLAPADFLTGQYTAFGRVVDGMDALNAITKTATPQGERPLNVEPDTLLGVDILVR